ncbi:T9SS type A sorting domain-containing protein, partial [bacterium]|nr:T9SS type A sorting domain-containing protein [bacterium]
PGTVTATVYNILGQPVRRVDYGRRQAGAHGLTWQIDAGLPAGAYLLAVEVDGDRVATRKLLVVR